MIVVLIEQVVDHGLLLMWYLMLKHLCCCVVIGVVLLLLSGVDCCGSTCFSASLCRIEVLLLGLRLVCPVLVAHCQQVRVRLDH